MGETVLEFKLIAMTQSSAHLLRLFFKLSANGEKLILSYFCS